MELLMLAPPVLPWAMIDMGSLEKINMELVKSLAIFEQQLGWLARGCIFWSQILVLGLISGRWLLADFGAERLVWNERPLVQFVSLFAMGILAAQASYIWFLLDRPLRLLSWLAEVPPWLALYPRREPDALTAPGQWVLLVLLGFGAWIFLSKWISAPAAHADPGGCARRTFFQARRWLLPGLAGYLAAILFPTALFALDDAYGIRHKLADWLPQPERFRAFDPADPTGTRATPPSVKLSEYFSSPSDLLEHHEVALYLVGVNLVLLGLLILAYVPLQWFSPRAVVAGPVVILCLVLILLNQLYGYFVFNMPWALLVVLVLIGLLGWFNRPSARPYRYRFPGLEKDYEQPLDLSKTTNKTPTQATAEPWPGLNDAGVLQTQIDLLRGEAQEKPRIILVAVSGGGIRAAVWSALILERLPDRLFRHVRLITGASGGMVGAAAVVGLKAPRNSTTNQAKASVASKPMAWGLASKIVSQQALLPVVQTLILRDWFWNLFWPARWYRRERNRELEQQWRLAAEDQIAGTLAPNPFTRTLADLYPAEARGELPSLVFTPVTVEDTRSVMISNLDLQSFTGTETRTTTGAEGVLAIELFRLWPHARWQLDLATISRMNASFPLISSNVSLPCHPPRRLIDAGLGDNYGIAFLADWIQKHKERLQQETSGVAILELRAFPKSKELREFRPAGGGIVGFLTGLVAAVSHPLMALFKARGQGNLNRNMVALRQLDQLLNPTVGDEPGPRFFHHLVWELDREAALSWHLSRVEQQNIVEAARSLQGEITNLDLWVEQNCSYRHTTMQTQVLVPG